MQLTLPIDALILDIGNVVCEWNPVKLAHMAYPGSGDPDSAAVTEVVNTTVGHPDWLELDRGTLLLSEAIANAKQRSSNDHDWIEAVYRKTPVSLAPLADSVAAMQEAHAAGLPMFVLSNMQAHAGEYLLGEHVCFSWVQHVVLSCDCQLMKPEPAIYRHLIETCDLTAERCVFLDDMPENVSAARASGLQAQQASDIAGVGAMIREITRAYSSGI